MNDISIIKKKNEIIFRNNGLSDNSKAIYGMAVRQYLEFIKIKKMEPGIDSIRIWLNQFSNAKTFNIKLQGIKEYFFALFKDLPADKLNSLHENFKSIKRKKPMVAVQQSDFITFDQFKKIINKIPYRYSLFIQALYWTGCRISELLDIENNDCIVSEIVTIRIKDGKGGKERQVYMQFDLFDEIKKEFKGKKYLFETYKFTRYNRSNVSMHIKKDVMDILNIDVSAHTFRHSKAMYLKDVKNLSADQIAKALGHSSVVTTLQHYFHGTPSANDQGIY